jgi:phosphomannomutase
VLLWRCLQLTESIPDRLVVTTVVSSRLAGAIAHLAGAHFAETLTGFKWLSRPAIENPDWHQVLAYEEALGYAVGPDARDKDGITAALVMSDAVCSLAADGRTVWDVLDELACLHGAHVTHNGSVALGGPDARDRLAELTRSLAADPPGRLGPSAVVDVAQPSGDVIRLDLTDGTRVVLRPSGTEPKFKYYCEAVEPVAPEEDPVSARERAGSRLTAIAAELERVLT